MLTKIKTKIIKNLTPTWQLRAFALTQVPLLLMTSPQVLKVSDKDIEVLLPLTKVNKNHLGSMYFGALNIGAESAVGILAVHHINKSGQPVAFVFKDFKASFLKRAESGVIFSCQQGQDLKDLVQQTIESGERRERLIHVIGRHHEQPDLIVAQFELTISLKAIE